MRAKTVSFMSVLWQLNRLMKYSGSLEKTGSLNLVGGEESKEKKKNSFKLNYIVKMN